MLRARTDEAKDERRQALLSAALDEFFEKGFAASRMSDIARRAHLSKGTLYLYFDSKEAMFKALVESLAFPNLEQIERIAEGARTLDEALNGIGVFAPALIRHSELPRLMKVLIGDSHMFPSMVAAYRKELIERVIGMVAALLKRVSDAGEADVENPELTARIIIAPIVLSGLWHAVFNRNGEADVDLETLFQTHARLMLKALKPGNPT
ncbi:MAG: TetR/AcrR family transcriptional regulator [Rhodobiaceae bacterium]|nr:TetR/AcrR family transcriptional regulator [Hyphomonas sp.]MCB9971255.1 TetR/AcrR family transcriptional regulator [Hyphomonas sp.]MCC0050324.1 TetR/AcrR family transcriptional regulator [Rhodobiaceae bacterium]